jgi:hypothetical protein
MNVLQVFAIYDAASEAYMQPYFNQTIGAAIRSFSDAVNDNSTMLGKHAEDFTLFQIGSFDDTAGVLEGMTPKRIVSALEVKLSHTKDDE